MQSILPKKNVENFPRQLLKGNARAGGGHFFPRKVVKWHHFEERVLSERKICDVCSPWKQRPPRVRWQCSGLNLPRKASCRFTESNAGRSTDTTARPFHRRKRSRVRISWWRGQAKFTVTATEFILKVQKHSAPHHHAFMRINKHTLK